MTHMVGGGVTSQLIREPCNRLILLYSSSSNIELSHQSEASAHLEIWQHREPVQRMAHMLGRVWRLACGGPGRIHNCLQRNGR